MRGKKLCVTETDSDEELCLASTGTFLQAVRQIIEGMCERRTRNPWRNYVREIGVKIGVRAEEAFVVTATSESISYEQSYCSPRMRPVPGGNGLVREVTIGGRTLCRLADLLDSQPG